ncbi:MAG: hypothetical protein WBD47_10815 [Phormidesmis sp.]
MPISLLIASALSGAIAPESLPAPLPEVRELETTERHAERTEPTGQTSPAQTETLPSLSSPSESTISQQVTCGPDQFVSAFSDVYPTDWAYQSVNRLASRPAACFDLPADNNSR